MKIKTTALIIIILASFFSASFIPDQNSRVPWKSQTQLQWKDFKSAPDDSSPFKALTSWGLGYDITYENKVLTVNISCYFIPEKSWVKEGHTNDYLLNHERQHFNIAQIYARKFQKEVDAFKAKLTKVDQSTGKAINKIYDKIMNDCNAEQLRYDKETRHSLNKEAQAKWDTYIQQSLSKK